MMNTLFPYVCVRREASHNVTMKDIYWCAEYFMNATALQVNRAFKATVSLIKSDPV